MQYKQNNSLTLAVAGIACFVVVGGLLLVLSHAATMHVSAEVELGAAAAGAQVVGDTTATGGKAARFGTGQTALPVGNLLGWSQIYTEDFTTAFPVGSFKVDPSSSDVGGTILPTATPYARYGSKLKFYPDGTNDTHGISKSYASKTVSTQSAANSNGVLDIWMHTENVGTVATPMASWQRPLLPSGSPTQLYGRYAYRMRSDAAPGYGAVGLLITDPWPDNGEQDWPEGDTAGSIKGFYHFANPLGGQQPVAPTAAAKWTDWHTYVIEWKPGSAKWYMDGKLILDTTREVGAKPYKFVVQAGGSDYGGLGKPAASVSGHIQIDWWAIWKYAP